MILIDSIETTIGSRFRFCKPLYEIKMYGISCTRLSAVVVQVIPQTISFIPCFHPLRFSDDIEWMTGHRPNLYWQATWRVISPLMLLVVFLAYVVDQAQHKPTYEAWNPDYVRTTNTGITLNTGLICQVYSYAYAQGL